MTRRMCFVALAAALALGLLCVKPATAADDQNQKVAQDSRWDDGGPIAKAPSGQLAQRGPDGFGPPGPPRDGDDDRPMPPPGKRADRGQPRDGGMERPMGPHEKRRGPGFDDRQPMGHDGPKDGPGADRGQPMGPPPEGGPLMGGPRPEGQFPGLPFGPHGDWQSLEKKDPELFALLKKDMEMERKTRELVRDYRQASKDDRDKIKQQIEEQVAKHFDVRQQRRALELKRLEQELQGLREKMDRRSKAKKEIVDKRVSELTGQGDDLGF
ncbi:MAG: hypothetical protein LLG00_13930 [Planctomycetaceae bacterium]|nr:hypothetical protein [Planctomycetaceae bacterium]